MHIAGKSKGSTGQVLLQLLEMRLDNIVFRLNMASTIPGARQLVNHRHILVNGHIVDIPSYRCKPRDIITTKNNERSFDKTKILKPEMSKHLIREVENADSRGEIQGLKKKKRQTVTLESRLKKPTESKKSKFNYCRKTDATQPLYSSLEIMANNLIATVATRNELQ
ncbi:ribosomal protein S4 [Carex littledalei]|uniref:Small ribosomal subunit protein uS4c n=1 Tax=Carex littledalei TaxID=544730 RepID=A0A833RL98_9POAL|nr:ribosomal protein S4 [Carex littledalei]